MTLDYLPRPSAGISAPAYMLSPTGEPTHAGDRVSQLDVGEPFPEHPVAAGARPTTVPSRYFPQLPLEERDRRWDRLRKKMLLADVDALLFVGSDIYWDMGNANIRYIFGIAAKMGSTGAFFMDSDPALYNAVSHMSRPFHYQASLQDWTRDIRVFRGPKEVAAEFGDRGVSRGRIGIVSFSSTIQPATLLKGEYEAYSSLLPDATFVDFNSALQEMRMVKSEIEIGQMRVAGRIARHVIDVLVESAVPGATEAGVYANMVKAQIESGAEPNIFQLFASGPVEHPEDELWHLLHGSDQPMVPTMRPLSDGDLIVCEWHTKYGGYLVHTEYTVYLGDTVPKQLEKIFAVSVECLDASREAFQPGNTLREAWEAIRRPAEKAGLNWVELGWHAMGLASPEFPTVVYKDGYGSDKLNGSRIGDFVLEEGMTFGNNIDMHDRSWKSDVGCMYADFMVVRPGGAELLVNTPRTIGRGGHPTAYNG